MTWKIVPKVVLITQINKTPFIFCIPSWLSSNWKNIKPETTAKSNVWIKKTVQTSGSRMESIVLRHKSHLNCVNIFVLNKLVDVLLFELTLSFCFSLCMFMSLSKWLLKSDCSKESHIELIFFKEFSLLCGDTDIVFM